MLYFAEAVSISLAIGVAAALWQAKPGNRLRDALGVAGTGLILWLLGGLAVLLGVPIHGISD